jgi:hypothetical protein
MTERQPDPEEDDDRAFGNMILLVLVAALVGGGIWIASVMLDVRKVQDCAASGRRNCAPVDVPPQDSR